VPENATPTVRKRTMRRSECAKKKSGVLEKFPSWGRIESQRPDPKFIIIKILINSA
jgi:hypothetical protein